MTLVLIGGSHGETEPGKATYPQEGTQQKNPYFTGDKFPPRMLIAVARV
jgi:hypothetical protein